MLTTCYVFWCYFNSWKAGDQNHLISRGVTSCFKRCWLVSFWKYSRLFAQESLRRVKWKRLVNEILRELNYICIYVIVYRSKINLLNYTLHQFSWICCFLGDKLFNLQAGSKMYKCFFGETAQLYNIELKQRCILRSFSLHYSYTIQTYMSVLLYQNRVLLNHQCFSRHFLYYI